MNDYIEITGAKENNLKNISIKVPKNKLVIMTGLSGSGKSSLAFDTLYQEGQRRYIESLSTYARQFLGGFEKPNVERIEGLSPAISIDQKSTSNNPRSTVGTITEIYDYLRLLYARVGVPYSYKTGLPLSKQTIEEMTNKVLSLPLNEKVVILSPIFIRQKGTFKKETDYYIKEGYTKAYVDNAYVDLEDFVELDKNKNHDYFLVIDRLVIKEEIRNRVFQGLELACKLSKGYAKVFYGDKQFSFSEVFGDIDDNITLPELEPRLFSFNTPIGACQHCNGIGVKYELTERKAIDENKAPLKGGIIPFKNNFEYNLSNQEIEIVAKHFGINLNLPMKELSKEHRRILLYGSKEELSFKTTSAGGHVHEKKALFEGVLVTLNRRYKDTSSEWIREWLENFMEETICPLCGGKRLNKAALAVKVNGLDIISLSDKSIEELLIFMKNLPLNNEQKQISSLILTEINNRLSFLSDVGLEYLTLSRKASTLSGGEAQRIRLATQIGSKLSGVLYVLDEPSIGLHQRDNKRLLAALREMRDLGNTLVVVEHDEETMREADYLIDFGPGAGIHGGEIVAEGTPLEVMNNPNSITGKYLKGILSIPIPTCRRPLNKGFIKIINAHENNLKNIDVNIPLAALTCITGVSGSGKSTLVHETLVNYLHNKYYKTQTTIPAVDRIDDLGKLSRIIEIDQSPIGRSPRSNPVTYVGVFDDIRDVFSLTSEAKIRGYKKGRFSFNVKGGRCEACQGDGVKRISMHFLPDVYVPCEECHGQRYNSDTLQIKYKGKSIAAVLDMTIEDSLTFFENHSKIKKKLQTLYDVGLGYLTLGQPSTTLSGGEAQRIKLASELCKNVSQSSLYVLDEPTTGLHTDDVKKLLSVLSRIVDNGATMIVIEHNLDVIKSADYIIDLGPEGGYKGGQVVACGRPEEIALVESSFTGQYLKNILK